MTRSLDHLAGAVAALGVVALAAACGTKAPLGTARVVGTIEQCGGPAPGRCRPVKTPVTVLDPQHRAVATAKARGDGHFSFTLRPGSYALTAMGQLGSRSVAAEAHETVTANIVVPLR
jgi:hypothetical protein